MSNYQDIINKADSLRDCTNKMCTVGDIQKLSNLYSSAGIKLSELMLMNAKRIRNKEEK